MLEKHELWGTLIVLMFTNKSESTLNTILVGLAKEFTGGASDNGARSA